jgi:hypothetical protein
MKLLYIPNEREEGDQIGPRAALAARYERGELSGFRAFSYLVEAKRLGSPAKALAKLTQVAEEFGPDVVLWQHVDSFPVSDEQLAAIKALPSRPLLVYHEGDVYGRTAKPLTRSLRAFARCADLVAVIGLGPIADAFRAHGARRIVYAPHSVDLIRFGTPWTPTQVRCFDVVMVGNRFRSLFRSRKLPGNVTRERLARRLWDIHGERFAVYGSGWNGYPFARGPIPFSEQERVLRESWLSVNWDNFHEIPFYFSDRLPIGMASGVAHVTSYQPGYEHVFRDGEHIAFARSVEQCVEVVDYLLSRPRTELMEMGARGQAWVRERLCADVVWGALMARVRVERDDQRVRRRDVADPCDGASGDADQSAVRHG